MKQKEQHEAYMKQCLNILESVEGYIEERADEKSKKTNMLDSLGSQDLLIAGLPELAHTLLKREQETNDNV